MVANDKYPSYSSVPIEWPKNLAKSFATSINDENKELKDVENNRPDSGVGESVIYL